MPADLISLIISDVLGDPLDVIASGPTRRNHRRRRPMRWPCSNELGLTGRSRNWRRRSDIFGEQVRVSVPSSQQSTARVTNLVIGNNAPAVDAAGCEAERLGYSHAMIAADRVRRAGRGRRPPSGRNGAADARSSAGPNCLISGGEPTVKLVDEAARGKGGRNQQLALAALAELGDCDGIALLSGGTDGEDGPTDAAGAVVTAEVVQRAAELRLDPRDYLRRNDAYHFFDAAGGLFKTGPTQTNVCDLRVVVMRSTRSLKRARRLSPTTIDRRRGARDRSRCGPWRRFALRRRADWSG